MKKCIFLLVFVCGCGTTKEYSTQCSFPLDKPTHTTIEIKVSGKY
jgi:hypothetical protein